MVAFIPWFFISQPANILRIGGDFLAWGWQFFSVGFFARRLFAPWHRDITGYGRGFDLARFLRVFSWNLISRVIGATMRVSVMIFGLFVEIFIVMLFALTLVFWYLLPLIIPVLIFIGIFTMFV